MAELEELMKLPVAPRLSPSTHPGIVQRFSGDDDMSVSLRRNLANALDGLYRWSAVFDATLEAANSDARYGIRAAKLKQVAATFQGPEGPTVVTDAEQHILRHAEPAYRRAFDKGTSYASKIDYLRGLAVKRIDDAMTTEEGLGVIEGQEVRAHVKSMNDLDRMRFIHRLQESGDRASLLALIRAKPFLSGLSEKDVEAIKRHLWPTEHQTLDRIAEAHGIYLTAVQQAKDRFERMKARVEKLPGAKAATGFGAI
jgi:hypothetical protein